MTAAAFLDRDGVINRKAPDGRYITSWEEFEFLPGAPAALRSLRQRGVRLLVVTNQRGVALGLMTASAVDEVHARMNEALRDAGGEVDGIFVCPHAEGVCDCRKPRTGLFLQALARFPNISLPESFVIGDSLSDLEAGHRLGCRIFLVAPADRAATIALQAAARGIALDGVATSLAELVSTGLLFQREPAGGMLR